MAKNNYPVNKETVREARNPITINFEILTSKTFSREEKLRIKKRAKAEHKTMAQFYHDAILSYVSPKRESVNA